MFNVIDFLDEQNIDYSFVGGTLLRIGRDDSLLSWNRDIDLSISVNDADKFYVN